MFDFLGADHTRAPVVLREAGATILLGSNVFEYVSWCAIHQKVKVHMGLLGAPHYLEFLNQPFEQISLHFVSGLIERTLEA